MRVVVTVLLVILTFCVLGLVGVAVVMGWSLGLAWVLLRLVPEFSQFEASLLVMLATMVVIYTAWQINIPVSRNKLDDDWDEDDEDIDEDDDDEEMVIPLQRFLKNGELLTAETWFLYQLSNDLYAAFAESNVVGMMNSGQVEALAVRLAEIFIAILKRKTGHTTSLVVTADAVRKEMNKIGQHPYDDNILQVAVTAVNSQLALNEMLADVVRYKTWRTKR